MDSKSDYMKMVQTALSAVLATAEQRDADARELMFSVADQDKWKVVSSLLGIAAMAVIDHCEFRDEDPIKYLRGAVLAADPALNGGSHNG